MTATLYLGLPPVDIPGGVRAFTKTSDCHLCRVWPLKDLYMLLGRQLELALWGIEIAVCSWAPYKWVKGHASEVTS